MIDALGRPQSVLLLGATSEIGQAICAQWADCLTRIHLAGRPTAQRDLLASQWQQRGVITTTSDFDAAAPNDHAELITSAFGEGEVDVVILAFGVLGDQQGFEADPTSAATAVTTNYVGAVSAGLAAASALETQGHGKLVVLSSVAGLRARRSNYVYGSSKAGLDAFALGLADRLQSAGVQVLVVRPGFVRTSMTAGLDPAPLSVGPQDVAEAVVRGLANGRRVIYVPSAMRLVMLGLRSLPGPVFRRLPI